MKLISFNCKSILTIACLLYLSVAKSQQQAYESPAGTKFLLYTPPGYSSTSSTFPLLLSLHSKGEVGNDLSELTSNNPEQMPCRLIYINKWPQDLPFIVLTPQLKPDPNDPEIQWSAEYIDEVVRYVVKNFRVDLNRFYVTGISRGGTGVWTYASAFPQKVAALLPMSGRSDLTQACPIKDIPIWAFHGDDDGVAPPEYSIDMVNAIKACQPPGTYTPRLNIMHARNHNGWNEIYNGTSGYKVYDWLLMFGKNDTSNKKPYVNAGPDLRIQLRDEPLNIIGDFFDFDGQIKNVIWKQTAGSALALNQTGSNLLEITELKTGLFEFELTVTDDKGAQNTDRVSLEITGSSAGPVITQLILLNGKTNLEISNLSEGQVINKTALNVTEVNIRAMTSSGTASVKFSVNTDQNTRTQNAGPYFIKSQTTYPEWTIQNGTYLICVTPYAQTYARGNPGVSQCYKITVTEGADSGSCEGTGNVRQELWTGVSGTMISSIPIDKKPASMTDLALFEGPGNIGDNYGRRIRGYICPPASGNYVFWLASNDNSELWLSTDGNQGNKKKIAFVSGYTNARQWDKYTSQKSGNIPLSAGQRYYIEALHKEGTGTDHVAVGWQLPTGVQERPIPGIRLIPFDKSADPPVVNITRPSPNESFTAPASLTIAADASSSAASIAKLEFYNGAAKLGEDTASPYSYTWNNVPSGNYILKAKAYDNAGGSATAEVRITVASSGAACAASGTILRETWTGIPNNDVASIPTDTSPDGVSELRIFEDPANVGDNFGTRVSGYLCVPATGMYTFWISSNDHSELWLSTDSDRLNRRRIAWVTGFTNVREWSKFASQKSTTINLIEGQSYYIEALHKEGVGSDHMAVGWQLPSGTLERPIPANRLSPFQAQKLSTASTIARPAADSEPISMSLVRKPPYIFPNPAPSGSTQITIHEQKNANDDDWTVQVIGITGEILHEETITAQGLPNVGNQATFEIKIARELKPGIYLINVISNGQRSSTRLFVN